MTFDLIVKGGLLADSRQADIAIANGKIAAVEPGITAEAREVIDATGRLVSQPFVDCHFHMDATLSYGMPRVNASGTLLEGISLWGELKRLQRREDIVARALEYCRMAMGKGVLAIRSHVDTTDLTFRTVEALLEVRETIKGKMDLQLVAFPQEGWLRSAGGEAQVVRALDAGVDIPLISEAQVAAIPNPLINITLQGRADTYPKRRGMTRVPEVQAAGVTVAFGQDCVMDPWYPLGSGDMLDVAHMGLHVALMTGTDQMREAFQMVTAAPARIMGLDFGLHPGARASLVVLDCATPIDAIRLRPARIAVISDGALVARTIPAVTTTAQSW